jgi:hypothetical protein
MQTTRVAYGYAWPAAAAPLFTTVVLSKAKHGAERCCAALCVTT